MTKLNRREVTYAEFCDLPFDYIFGMTTDICAARRYVNQEFGLVKEVVTDRKKPGNEYSGWKEPKVCYFMTDDPWNVMYPNYEILYEAYMHRVCGITYEQP